MQALSIGPVILLLGCGAANGLAARSVLEKPVLDQCTDAGLRRCSRITEGILLVAEGKKEAGVEKIREGAVETQPQEFQDFVATMKLLGKVPGADPYVEPINQVLAAISPEVSGKLAAKPATAAAEPAAPQPSSPLPTENSTPSRSLTEPAQDSAKFDGETVVPLANLDSRPCALGVPFSPLPENVKGRCVRERQGPIVITDLHAAGGCGADMFALAGSLSAPRWVMYVPAGSSLHVTGAALVVGDREFLVIGGAPETKLKSDVRCALTWTGRRGPISPDPNL